MIEIKFRVWDEKNKKMIYDFFISSDGFPFIIKYDTFHDEYYGEMTVEYTEVLKGVIMQYTGLKDKKGKEIYEGDIVEAEYFVQGVGVSLIKGVIVFKNGSFGIDIKEADKETDKGLFFPLDWDEKIITVIGNIYENKELLKEV